MLRKIKKILKPFYYLTKFRFDDWKRTFYHQYFPPKPHVINLNANDICNSKCTMCNIWQQKKDFEITPENLATILQDKLFSDIRHVGITGGEPTLREDLPALYEACCKTLPTLHGLSIITNAIKSKDVIKRIEAVYEVCQKHHKTFSIMVSLDGYGETHERVRGREGNFASAMEVINHFRQHTDIPIAVGCTISKVNVWEVDVLLDFLREQNLYGRFRVAEHINRLYNADRGEVIRNFDEEELYHLACFFKKLELTYETNETYQRTYRSIIGMLGGAKRQIGCPYQTKGVVLDSRGDMHYCAPKSKKLGNSLKESALQLFKGKLSERRRILKENCDSCIHDYHAPITYKEQLHKYKSIFWKDFFTIQNIARAKYLNLWLPFASKRVGKGKNVYIVGWYGTETVGDKAILGQIVDFYKEKYTNVNFYISSLYPFITEKTIRELDIQATVVPCDAFDFARFASQCDEVVMGGGPLMDMEALAVPLWAFKVAKMYRKKTVVFGCGLGPLSGEKYIKAVKQILLWSDEIKLRDNKSVLYAQELTGRQDIVNSGDGAFAYISKLNKQITVTAQKPVLACFLREWSAEYKGNLSEIEFLDMRDKFEANTALIIKQFCKENDVKPAFYPMHTFTVGGDDREFYRRFLKKYFDGEDYFFYTKNAQVRTTVEAMKTAKFNLCMRFHSVLFAHTLKTNFMAIDYTQGGKIHNFLSDNQDLHKLLDLKALAYASTDDIQKISASIFKS